ncbi:MAG: 3-dehydroquinate synthase [Gammaproteobacteria bacterium]|nr:3-dehydroquinate synthase [Gammaproteobacteria bacterium]
MKQVVVELGDRSYPIYIGAGLLAQAADLLGPRLSGQTLVVSNTVVAPLYLDALLDGLPDITSRTLIVEDGERRKTVETMNAIITRLLEERFSRTCTLVALGGGVIGDVTGFAAACYQRGVSYVQVPTTLLAQVDSAVGGKTAVNHRLGKNMIGAFHQPAAVLSDTDVLASLPERELRAGVAEIIKYGLINDAQFFDWLEDNMDGLLQRDADCLAHAIEVSCRNKAAIVSRDEREAGLRAILNLGHTFGHAIETALNYETWLHGEAVAAGMSMAAHLSARTTGFPESDVRRVNALLEKTGLPVTLPETMRREHLRELMAVDKKTRHGRLHLVLLREIGKAVVTPDFEEADLEDTLARYAE